VSNTSAANDARRAATAVSTSPTITGTNTASGVANTVVPSVVSSARTASRSSAASSEAVAAASKSRPNRRSVVFPASTRTDGTVPSYREAATTNDRNSCTGGAEKQRPLGRVEQFPERRHLVSVSRRHYHV